MFMDAPFINKMSCMWRRKPHLIWVLVDGMAIDQIQQLFEWNKDDALAFKLISPDFRESGPIHETYMTGIVSRNLNGKEIETDNVLNQIPFSTYIGGGFPMKKLGNKYYNEKIELSEKYDEIMLGGICPVNEKFLTKLDSVDKLSNPKFQSILDDPLEWERNEILKEFAKEDALKKIAGDKEWKKCLEEKIFTSYDKYNKDKTLIYYNGYMDHTNHHYSKSHIQAFYLAYRLEIIFDALSKYISNNRKNYVLVLSSDHGGQVNKGDDSVSSHGILDENNHAFLYISSDDLKGKGYKSKTDYTDVASTVSLTTQNLNIPLQNEGVPQPQFPDDPFAAFLHHFSHFNQKVQLCTEIGKLDADFKEKFEKDKKVKLQEVKELIEKLDKNYQNEDVDAENFFDKENVSIVSEKNQQFLNEQKELLEKTTKLLIKQNEILTEYAVDFRINNKNIPLLVGLVGLGTLALIGIVFFNKSFLYQNFVLTLFPESFLKKENIATYLGLILFFTPNVLAFFIVDLKRDLLYIGNGIFVVAKVLICFTLKEKTYIRSIKNEEEGQNMNMYQSYSSQNDEMDEEESGQALKLSPSYTSSLTKSESSSYTALCDKRNTYFGRKLSLVQLLFVTVLIDCVQLFLIKTDFFRYCKREYEKDIYKIPAYYATMLSYLVFYLCQFYEKKEVWANEHRPKKWVYMTLFGLMVLYDNTDIQRTKTEKQYQMNTVILTILFYFWGFCMIKDPVGIKGQIQTARNNFHEYSKKLLLLFIFYVGDITDKWFMLLLFFPVTRLYTNFIHDKLVNKKHRIIAMFCLIREATMFFLVCHGTLEAVFSIGVGKKTFGRTLETHYFFTAFIFGTNKFQGLVIPLLYLFSNINYKKMSENGKVMVMSSFNKLMHKLLYVRGFLAFFALFLTAYLSRIEGFYFHWSLFFAIHEIVFSPVFVIPHIVFCIRNFICSIGFLQRKYVMEIIFVVVAFINLYIVFSDVDTIDKKK